MRSRILPKLIFASRVGYFDRAYYGCYVTSSRMLVIIEEDKMFMYRYEVLSVGGR